MTRAGTVRAAIALGLSVGGALTAAAPAAAAQRAPAATDEAVSAFDCTVTTSGGARDTLGLLVVAVAPNGRADRAGVTEGSRIAAVNGVSLRLNAADVGQRAAGDAVLGRLRSAAGTLVASDAVALQVVSGGQRRTVTLAPAAGPPVASPTTPGVASAVAPPSRGAVGGFGDGSPPTGAVLGATTGVAGGGNAPIAAVPPAGASTATPPTLAGLIESMGALQQQLHRLARGQDSLTVADSLADAEEDLATVRRRLRGVQARLDRAVAGRGARTDAPAVDANAVPGLRLAPVDDELAAYFGAEGTRGLLVLQAEAAWDPLRPGDVITRVNGAAADAEHLRAVATAIQAATTPIPAAAGQPTAGQATSGQLGGAPATTVEFLRRRRLVTVTFGGRAGV